MRYAMIGLVFALALGQGPELPGADPKSDFLTPGLEGWDGLKDYWTVKEGALVGSTAPAGLKFNTFLCSKKKYKDFELRFQIRLKNGTGNSGVQIRSEIFDQKNFAVRGPQCDIGQQYWGSLYGEHFGGPKPNQGGMMQAAPTAVVAKVLKKDDFNDYSIRCVGKHVTIKLNGQTTVDGSFANMPDEGIIAWQLHSGGPMEVTFRNVEFKNLSAK
jgi:hypothetical protein